jgi:hypothetical protein
MLNPTRGTLLIDEQGRLSASALLAGLESKSSLPWCKAKHLEIPKRTCARRCPVY